ncbi:MAG: hypothetical protein IT424_03055, partial [Pirellulales bacterium]|nr:hypothetical protein [Pirellulales bacterium]
MGLNTRNRPGARRGERLAGQSAAGGRRLAIELCEQRLALSTTAGGVAALLEGPALDDEGGAVVVQGLEFAAGDATALASMKFAFTGGFDLDEAAGAISAVRHRVLFNTGGEQPGRPWPLVLNGTGLQVTDNAFADYDSSPFSPISGELEIAVGADAATTLERAGAAIGEFGSMTRVLPIAPPQEAPLDDGGAILMTAFAGRTPWGAPARG